MIISILLLMELDMHWTHIIWLKVIINVIFIKYGCVSIFAAIIYAAFLFNGKLNGNWLYIWSTNFAGILSIYVDIQMNSHENYSLNVEQYQWAVVRFNNHVGRIDVQMEEPPQSILIISKCNYLSVGRHRRLEWKMCAFSIRLWFVFYFTWKIYVIFFK